MSKKKLISGSDFWADFERVMQERQREGEKPVYLCELRLNEARG
jgi:hypothetical protein